MSVILVEYSSVFKRTNGWTVVLVNIDISLSMHIMVRILNK